MIGIRAVRYDDIYQVDEISLSFHIMFNRLYRGVAKYIVYGNTLSDCDLYTPPTTRREGETERPQNQELVTKRGLHLEHGHTFLNTAVYKQPILSR